MKPWAAMTVATITALGMIFTAYFTARAQADTRVIGVTQDLSVLKERESNHYTEVQKSIEAENATLVRIENKIDALK